MTRHRLSWSLLLTAGLVVAWSGAARADGDGRAGTVEWSDGRKLAGAISLTPGKDLRIYANNAQAVLRLAEVQEIRFKPEKEEMAEGFYFPNPGQTTQAKTGEVYPVRYLQTQIALANGQALVGHLFTTTFYVETDDNTEKVVIMAKQTGANGQKLADLAYPTAIRFDGGGSAGSAQIDLTQAGFVPLHPPIILVRPDLSQPPMQQTAGKEVWTVPSGHSGQILFAVEARDGIHVAWPDSAVDPALGQAVDTGLKVMRDFYDTRTQLGCIADAEAGDIYSLVMMKRLAKSVDPGGNPISADIIPWSLVILRWKYDPEQKKTTLLNRVLLKIGRTEGNSAPPTVFKEPGLLKDVAGVKQE